MGPLVVLANQVSDLDPLVMAAVRPFRTLRRVYWGGDVARLFAGPVRRFFCRALHIFPVDARAPAASLALAQAVLKRGDSLIWFPEAWPSPRGELPPFLPGLATLGRPTRPRPFPPLAHSPFASIPPVAP